MSGDLKAKLALHNTTERLIADERFDDGRRGGADLRTFIVAFFWCRFMDGRDGALEAALIKAGLGRPDDKLRTHRWKELLRNDSPRYEPPTHGWTCAAPMLRGPRAGELCGYASRVTSRTTDPATGEWELRSWCNRHADLGDKARAYERSQQFPTPLPNTGGLLPCYINANNWPDLYAWATRSWEPPAIGICADDWQVLAKVHPVVPVPRFEVLAGESDGSGDAPAPALRLVSA